MIDRSAVAQVVCGHSNTWAPTADFQNLLACITTGCAPLPSLLLTTIFPPSSPMNHLYSGMGMYFLPLLYVLTHLLPVAQRLAGWVMGWVSTWQWLGALAVSMAQLMTYWFSGSYLLIFVSADVFSRCLGSKFWIDGGDVEGYVTTCKLVTTSLTFVVTGFGPS